MNAIVAANDDWGIGFRGRLLVRNKADMHRFVQLTMGGTVLMGRATFESFPGGALKGRCNVVLTRNPDFSAPNVEVVHSVDEALAAVGGSPAAPFVSGAGSSAQAAARTATATTHVASDATANHPESTNAHAEVWLIGGERVYRELLPYCSRVFVTRNHTTMPADAFFPNLDADSAWEVASTEPGGITKSGIAFDFVTYVRA